MVLLLLVLQLWFCCYWCCSCDFVVVVFVALVVIVFDMAVVDSVAAVLLPWSSLPRRCRPAVVAMVVPAFCFSSPSLHTGRIQLTFRTHCPRFLLLSSLFTCPFFFSLHPRLSSVLQNLPFPLEVFDGLIKRPS